jgi:hypothetical protein
LVIFNSLVIVDDLYIVGIAISPSEANSPLVVNANAVLAHPLASKSLEPIAGWHSQVLGSRRCIQHSELPERHILHIPPEPADGLAAEQALGIPVPKALDHAIA